MQTAIVTHPNNLNLFEKVAFSGQPRGSFVADGIKIITNEHVAERRISERWVPPTEAFTEYGPEDEEWMRPLGLGTVEYIDEGPLFYEMDQSAFYMPFQFQIAPWLQ